MKIAVSLTDMFPNSLELFTTQAALSDDIALPVEIFKQVDSSQDNIVVFDRGLAAHSCYAQMQTSQIWFITRLKDNVRCQHITNLQEVTGMMIGNLTMLSDEQINFPRHPQFYFRLIRAQSEKGKILSFLTNRFDPRGGPLSVEEVIRCYHKRWDIEAAAAAVFFRFLNRIAEATRAESFAFDQYECQWYYHYFVYDHDCLYAVISVQKIQSMGLQNC